MIRLIGRALTLTLLVIGFACTKGPDFVPPETPAPPAFRAEALGGESVANTPWWDLYEDPTLQALIRTGLENNRNLRGAMAKIAEARAGLGIVRAQLYPNVSVIGSGFYQVSSGQDSAKVFDNAKLALQTRYEVDLWGRVARTNESAQAALLATEESFRALTITLVSDIASGYLVLTDLDERNAIALRTLENRRRTFDLMTTLADEGLVPRVDADLADLAVAEVEALVQVLTRSRAQTENVISLLVGRLPADVQRGESLAGQNFPPSVPAGLPSELLQRRPDVLAAERSLHAQTARIGIAEAARFPSLSLTGSAGVKSSSLGEISSSNSFFNIGANIVGSLLNWGANKSQVEVERARTEQLLSQYELVVLNSFREVEDALVAVETYQNEHQIRVRQVATSRRALAASQVRYEDGMSSFLDVLDLESSVLGAELKATESLQRHHTAIVQLYKALGGGWWVQ